MWIVDKFPLEHAAFPLPGEIIYGYASFTHHQVISIELTAANIGGQQEH